MRDPPSVQVEEERVHRAVLLTSLEALPERRRGEVEHAHHMSDAQNAVVGDEGPDPVIVGRVVDHLLPYSKVTRRP